MSSTWWRAGIGLLIAATTLPVIGAVTKAPAPDRPPRRATIDDRTLATLEDSVRIFLEAAAIPHDTYLTLAARYSGTNASASAIEKANRARPVAAGQFFAIPFTELSPEYRLRVLTALFPADAPDDGAWVHRVPPDDDGQTLEAIALWFTGDANLADDLAESNGIEWAPLKPGTEVTIPGAILSQELSGTGGLVTLPTPSPDTVPPEPTTNLPPVPEPPPRKPGPPVRVGDLTFVDDDSGGYAIYRLKAGEAIYSSVVIRFTGRLDPDEVSLAAKRIAQLSGISKITSIPVGHRIKIPRELILPEYLPPSDPAKKEYETNLAATKRHELKARARDLQGVTILLDAGHGGDDIGAQRNGVHEDDNVFDIVCRIKEIAERTTAAKVLVTIKDSSTGFTPQDGPFKIDQDEVIMTTPAYSPRQPNVGTVGVNLRWYLVNSYYRALLAHGADPERIVFISVHADSLHPSVRGAMVYVPGQAYRSGTYGHVGQLYDRREVRELRYVTFSQQDKERSEGLSRRLASRVIDAFRAADLPVHPYEPVRNHVIRRGRAWTPAVIRTSLVPQSILLEVVNLNNPKDALLIQKASFRQQVAAAFIDALRRQYGDVPSAAVATAGTR